MSEVTEVIGYIRNMIVSYIKPAVRTGVVKNIDANALTCDVYPDENDTEFFLADVKLKSTTNESQKGYVVVPKDGSIVTAAMIDGLENSWCLLGVEEVDYVFWVNDKGACIYINNTGEVHINGSKYGGLVKVEELVKKLNALEQKHDALVTKFNTHMHSNGNNGSDTGVPTATSSDTIGQQTQRSDIESKMTKHGDNN